MDNNAIRERLLAMVKDFGNAANGQATLLAGESEYEVNMFRQKGLQVLTAAKDSLPEVFAVSDGDRVLVKSSPLCGINYVMMHVAEDDETKPLADRQIATFRDVVNDLQTRLRDAAMGVCADYVRAEWGDAEPLASCECEENEDAAIAASYWCNQTLIQTGSFEDMQNYVGVNMDTEVVQAKEPTFVSPKAFHGDVNDLEMLAYFFTGESAFRSICAERFAKCRDTLVHRYCDYCIKLVKYHKGQNAIADTDDESMRTALVINQAIKAFIDDKKYVSASKLTYTVLTPEGNECMFRVSKHGLMTAKGLPDERTTRVPNHRAPSWREYDRIRPEDVLEIRYVKHIVYRKAV
jgi:hypothetical protein